MCIEVNLCFYSTCEPVCNNHLLAGLFFRNISMSGICVGAKPRAVHVQSQW